MREFTKEELEQYNGQDDKPAYVVYNGKVYDVSESRMWRKGQHMKRHEAGADLTESFAQAPHGEEVLERVTQVGVLKGQAPAAQETAGEAPAWAEWLLDFHPHPILVHFPQAFFTFAPVFLIMSYVFKNPSFERTAFYLMAVGTLMAVPTVASGLFHWVYKYMRADGGIYKFKIALSIVVLVLAAAATFVHYSQGVLPVDSVNYTVTGLYLVLVPLIASLGHAGGIIVFGKK